MTQKEEQDESNKQKENETLQLLFKLVSDCVQNEIKRGNSIKDLQRRLAIIMELQETSRAMIYNEIVTRYPYPALRDCDRDIFKSMCLRGKQSSEVIEDKNSLDKAFTSWKNKQEPPDVLKRMAQAALAPVNIQKKSQDEIERVLEESLLQATNNVSALKKSVSAWLLTIKKAIDKRERERKGVVREGPTVEESEAGMDLDQNEATTEESEATEHVHCLTDQQREDLCKQYIFGTH